MTDMMWTGVLFLVIFAAFLAAALTPDEPQEDPVAIDHLPTGFERHAQESEVADLLWQRVKRRHGLAAGVEVFDRARRAQARDPLLSMTAAIELVEGQLTEREMP